MQKIVSHDYFDGGYSVHSYHPIFLRLKSNKSLGVPANKVRWIVLKQDRDGTWSKIPGSRVFEKKAEALSYAEFLLKDIIREYDRIAANNFNNQLPSRNDNGMNKEKALEILGLTGNVTKDDVKKKQRTLLKSLHPDLGGSTYLSKEINNAAEYLNERL